MNIEKLRTYCLSFPGTTEGIKWEEHLCFMVAEKIFCLTGMSDEDHVTFKVSKEDFEMLTERDGIIQASHMAKMQWVSVNKRNALSLKEWKHYLLQSYGLVKSKLTKKMQKEIG